MYTIVAIHHVQDFNTWLPVFEGDTPNLRKIGAKHVRVMKSIHDPNNLTVMAEIPDPDDFRKWIMLPERQE